jgi:hypothetical protein
MEMNGNALHGEKLFGTFNVPLADEDRTMARRPHKRCKRSRSRMAAGWLQAIAGGKLNKVTPNSLQVITPMRGTRLEMFLKDEAKRAVW